LYVIASQDKEVASSFIKADNKDGCEGISQRLAQDYASDCLFGSWQN
jgi:hypothetical protein